MKLRADNLSAREIDGDIVVLDLTSSQYFTVSGSGVVIFERLEAGATEDELVAAVCAEYDVEPERARPDVRAFVQHLVAAGLIDD